MAEHVIKLPDVGEGVAEAELVEWHVKVGDLVREDAVLAAVMTDKATVEIPAPVEGEIVWLGAEIGETIPVGSPIVRIRTGGEPGEVASEPEDSAVEPAPSAAAPRPSPQGGGEPGPSAEIASGPKDEIADSGARGDNDGRAVPSGMPRLSADKPLASPAVRLKAREAGIDLRQVSGTGPAGRITHEDIEQFVARGPGALHSHGLQRRSEVEDIKLVGLRRKIAEKMAVANRHIPHITYVEEIDMGALEDLRAKLNAAKRADQPKLTLLPFLMRAMVRAIADQPQLNALFDDEAGVIHRHAGIHIGIAAQTPQGLVVPRREALRGARSLGLRERACTRHGCGQDGHREPRRARRLDHHDHLARSPRRHRHDPRDQPSGGGDHRRQQDDGPADVGRNRLPAAPDDEPFLQLRPSHHRRP
jgi:2-oxoisovalerate dehydrogenase E2 component (dihydrolipoyl transacylase)